MLPLVLAQSWQQRKHQGRFVDAVFHPRERPLEIGVARPLNAVNLELGHQLTQVCHPLQQHMGLAVGRHARGILAIRHPRKQ